MEQSRLVEIIRDCQNNQPDGYERLLAEYGPRLYGYFIRASGSASEADDLLQELFVRLLEKIGQYTEENRFEHWLFRIAANLVRDRYRQRARKIAAWTKLTSGQTGRVEAETPAAERPDEQAQRAEERDRLAQALEQLPTLDREIIMLRHYGALSFKEIAEIYQMPIGTALSKVHRGLKQLRDILTGNDDEPASKR